MSIPYTTPAPQPDYFHDPRAILDYGWIFTELIEPADTIISVEMFLTLTSPGGVPVTGATLTLGVIQNTTNPQSNIVFCWFSVQDLTLVGKTVAATVRYTSAAGRSDERTIWLRIRYL